MRKIGLSILALLFSVSTALATDPVKIGMITTLSTKAGYLGEDIREGFKLAIDQGQGTLGGIPVELLVEDDGRKPEKGRVVWSGESSGDSLTTDLKRRYLGV